MKKLLALLMIVLFSSVGWATLSFDSSVQITGDGALPDLTCDSQGNFHVVWAYYKDSTDKYNICYARSTDMGRTWGWAVDDILDNDESETMPVIYVGQQGFIYATWAEDLTQTYASDYGCQEVGACIVPFASTPVFTARTITYDAGNQMWDCHDPVKISLGVENINGQDNIYIAAIGDKTADTGYEVLFLKYVDAKWDDLSGYTKINDGSHKCGSPSLAVKGLPYGNDDEICVAWSDTTDHEIMFDKSDDSGTSWDTDVEITDANMKGESPCLVITQAILTASAAYGECFCVWQDAINKIISIYFDYSSDDGATWGTDTILGDSATYTSYEQTQPDIVAGQETGYLYVVYTEGALGATAIYFQEGRWSGSAWVWGIDHDRNNTISGATELGKTLKVSDNETDNNCSNPQVSVDRNGNIICVYYDSAIGSIRSARLLTE